MPGVRSIYIINNEGLGLVNASSNLYSQKLNGCDSQLPVTSLSFSGEEVCGVEGFTFDTRVEDLRHVWIPLSLKMSISKSQGLEISSWPEGEEVSREPSLHPAAVCRQR